MTIIVVVVVIPPPLYKLRLRCGGQRATMDINPYLSLCLRRSLSLLLGVGSWSSSFWGFLFPPPPPIFLWEHWHCRYPHRKLGLALYGFSIQNSAPPTQALYPPSNLTIPTVEPWNVLVCSDGTGTGGGVSAWWTFVNSVLKHIPKKSLQIQNDVKWVAESYTINLPGPQSRPCWMPDSILCGLLASSAALAFCSLVLCAGAR